MRQNFFTLVFSIQSLSFIFLLFGQYIMPSSEYASFNLILLLLSSIVLLPLSLYTLVKEKKKSIPILALLSSILALLLIVAIVLALRSFT
ncbi:hypothetical protein H6501_04830 [Candidatus Woesearchaeota archaeon]|nr:hypothetical protein [Nanoarchaeota archaeon]MCB9370897.1 hypothetical protein [Candidatus Woesearchaeota archaeon]USN43998.1 MAG: hypothetical protein H6500_06435 [Candidatus Woesearchaeota archaeon]